MSGRYIEVYRDKTRKWRWRLMGGNGEKMSGSESYSSKSKALASARKAGEGPYPVKCPD